MKDGLRYISVEDDRKGCRVVIQMDGGGVSARIDKGDDAEAVKYKLIELANFLEKTVNDREVS